MSNEAKSVGERLQADGFQVKVLGAMGARAVDGEVAVGHAMDRFDFRGR